MVGAASLEKVTVSLSWELHPVSVYFGGKHYAEDFESGQTNYGNTFLWIIFVTFFPPFLFSF